MDALHQVLAKLSELGPLRRSGAGYSACCPAHEDRNPSLTVAPGKDQPVVIRCHTGCAIEDILAALGLTWDELCVPRGTTTDEWTPAGPAVDVYHYRDENGVLLYDVCRAAGKQFRQRVPDPSKKSGWRWSLGNVRRVLYRLPEIIAAVQRGEIIYVAEGEKDVKALVAAGVEATCNSGGTGGGWRDEYSEFLRGAVVVVIADKDADRQGYEHARLVAASLKGVAAGVEVVEAAEGKDAADHLAAGHSVAEFQVILQEDDLQSQMALTLREFLSVVEPLQQWVIPSMIERGDRLIWTGYEGLGKSWIVRQIAVAAAAGIHPFTGERFRPQRVLYVDCENPERLSRRSFRRIDRVATAQGRPVGDMLRIRHIPAGLDLSQEEDCTWLCELVAMYEPDLLTIGPFYRLHSSDTNDEKAARQVVSALDSARLRCGCALITEHHPGHGDPGNRSLRPTGSSLLMRWPEMGYGIRPCGEADEGGHFREVSLLPWRPPRDERHWPRKLVWGTDADWPWVEPVLAELNGHRRGMQGNLAMDRIGGSND